MLLLFVLVPFGYLAGGAYTETLPRPFNPKSWQAGAKIVDDRRCGMLADLRLRVGVTGKSREELIGILGQPQDTDNDGSTSYWLLCPSFLDIWVLRVRWDHGRAVEAFVHDT